MWFLASTVLSRSDGAKHLPLRVLCLGGFEGQGDSGIWHDVGAVRFMEGNGTDLGE